MFLRIPTHEVLTLGTPCRGIPTCGYLVPRSHGLEGHYALRDLQDVVGVTWMLVLWSTYARTFQLVMLPRTPHKSTYPKGLQGHEPLYGPCKGYPYRATMA